MKAKIIRIDAVIAKILSVACALIPRFSSRPAIATWVLLSISFLPITRAADLQNGGNHDGAISIAGETDTWTFTAAAGDSLLLRIATLTRSNTFNAQMRLFNPAGALIDTTPASGALADELTLTATVAGLYTVVVADDAATSGTLNGTGQYRIRFAKLPGPIQIADDGGPLTNGGNQDGLIEAGDLDFWTFNAAIGDSILLRIATLTGTNTFNAQMGLYGPNGTLIDFTPASGVLADELTLTATVAGLYTVVVSDDAATSGTLNGSGQYRIRFAKLPGAIQIADDGGPLTNGGNQDGIIEAGDLDFWTFTATAGDSILLRIATLTRTNTLNAQMRLYGPNGTLIDSTPASGDLADELAFTAINAGLYTVIVADDASTSGTLNGSGQYRIRFAKLPGPIQIVDDGGPLTSGGNQDGLIEAGDLDFWTFTAATGDSILLRIATLTRTNTLNTQMRLYGPGGTLIDSTPASGDLVDELALTATIAGLYTVVVADDAATSGTLNGSGQYRIRFAKLPGSIQITDDGGPLISGGNQGGLIEVGDLDFWTFTAAAGDHLLLRIATLTRTNTLNAQMRLYDPTGALIEITPASGVLVDELALTVTNTGLYTVVVADDAAVSGAINGAGQYRIHFVNLRGVNVPSSGDEGGALTNTVRLAGSISLGDLDLWSFNACEGDTIALQLEEVGNTAFNPHLRLYDRDGALLNSSVHQSTIQLSLLIPRSGTYRIVVTDGTSAGTATGSYQITGSGISTGITFCDPELSDTHTFLTVIGGVSAQNSILLSTTNLALPSSLWTSVITNQFDSFGVVNYTLPYSSNEVVRAFQTRHP